MVSASLYAAHRLAILAANSAPLPPALPTNLLERRDACIAELGEYLWHLAPTVYLDTETTGLSSSSRVVQIAIVDDDGRPLIDTLINPGVPIPPDASAIHGITDEMVRDAPTLAHAMPSIIAAVRCRTLVIYNSAYDMQFLPELHDHAARVECAMQLAMSAMNMRRWPRLVVAAAWAGHDWAGTQAHSALGDALAARTVYLHCLAERYP